MEKQVKIYLYKFSVNLYNGDQTFYFKNKEDARVARFIVCKDCDKHQSSSNMTPVRKISVMAEDLKKFRMLSSYKDFEDYWFEITDKMCEESLNK